MSRPCVVFLPGFLCDGRLFGPQVTHLTREGFECRVADFSGAASIERLASETLKGLPERIALVGLSMGGIIAFEIVRQVAGRVSHLALLNTTARRDAAGAARKAQLKRVVGGELDLVLRDELKPQYLAPDNRTPELLATLQDMGRDIGADVFVRQTMALTTRRDAFDLLGSITCPTLVIAGAEDRVCPVDRHVEIASAIPGARLQVIEGCGHISTLERPVIVNAALSELLRQPSGAAQPASRHHLRLVASAGRNIN